MSIKSGCQALEESDFLKGAVNFLVARLEKRYGGVPGRNEYRHNSPGGPPNTHNKLGTPLKN